MAQAAPSTPLISLEGVVLDTETTGLDASAARLVQIAALRIKGETISFGNGFDSLVDPGSAIPEASTRIHGIADADVRGAPSAAGILLRIADFIGDGVVIGHSIAFDMAILAREAERAGIDWTVPETLDIRPLAKAVAPTLAGYGLDHLCQWLDIEIRGRHTAMGDAEATARVYAALVPRLREAGIRTLAEARTACRRIDGRDSVAAGRPEEIAATEPRRLDEAAVERIDSYPYRHRVEEVMSAPPVRLPGGSVLRDALDALIEKKVSSVFVDGAGGDADDSAVGIVTERDALRWLHARGAAALDTPLAEIASSPVHAVRSDSFVYRAIGRMDRHGIRHLAVTDERGEIVGAVTTRNLLRHRAATAMVLGDEIGTGEDEVALGAAWAKVPMMARRLTAEGVDARQVAAVISSEIRMLTRRAAEIGARRMREAGLGEAPAPYAVLVLGSAGRGESLLSADQDNAIVYESGEAGGAEDRWFETLGGHIADILDRVGVPYCSGGVMAKNRAWRQSAADWRKTVDHWVTRQRPEDLLNVDIFFDGTPALDRDGLGDAIWRYAYERGRAERTFRRALSETLRSWQSPLGMFGSLRAGHDGRTDLKLGGLLPIFTAARVLSLRTGAIARATPDRLRGAAAAEIASADQIEGLVEAHRILLGTLLAQQIEDVENGIPPGPRVDTRRLDKAERGALVGALRRVPEAIDIAREGML
jgi:CBS domain-containing protein